MAEITDGLGLNGRVLLLYCMVLCVCACVCMCMCVCVCVCKAASQKSTGWVGLTRANYSVICSPKKKPDSLSLCACRLMCLYVCVCVIVVVGSALYQQQQVIQAVQQLYFSVSGLSSTTDRAERATPRDGAGGKMFVDG